MDTAPWLKWTMTVAFGLVTGYGLGRCGILAADRQLRTRASVWLSHLGHVTMGAAMVAMPWAGIAWDRWDIQITLFTLLGGWFFLQGLPLAQWAMDSNMPARVRLTPLYEALMMVAMVWMLLRHMESHSAHGGHGRINPVTVALAVCLGAAGMVWMWRLGAVIATGRGGGVWGPAGQAGFHALMALAMAEATALMLRT